MMKRIKIKLARMFHKESTAHCKARLKKAMRELKAAGMIYNIVADGEDGYTRNY
jgi:hypothetical protein